MLMLVPGYIGQETFLNALFELDEDQVTDGWWARMVEPLNLKCNLWLCPPEVTDLKKIPTLIWDKIDVVLFFINLSDHQVLKHLNRFKQIIVKISDSKIAPLPPVIVLGSYQQTSPLAEAQKRSVLEWSAEQADDWPFLEVDLEATENLPKIWHQILLHLQK